MALLRREVKDNCDQNDDLTFTFDPVLPSNGFMPVGETNLTVTVKDASNNIATTTVLLKVKDTEKPTFTECPNDLVFNLPDGQHTMKVEWNETELIVARDNDCSSANLVERETDQEQEPANGAMWSKGNYTIKYVATDASKNIAECSFVVAVIGDVTAPTMKGCVQSISMNTLLYTHYGIPGYHADDEKWPALTATDVGDMAKNLSTPITWEPNCGKDDCSLDGYAFPHGETKIVATATDAAGLTALCEFYVKVIDEQIPFWEDQNPNVECNDETRTGELDYQQCGGDTIVAKNKINATKHYEVELTTFKGKEACCDTSFTCMKINDHYSQCKPSLAPSASPTSTPTNTPTGHPSASPTGKPTGKPTAKPTTKAPTRTYKCLGDKHFDGSCSTSHSDSSQCGCGQKCILGLCIQSTGPVETGCVADTQWDHSCVLGGVHCGCGNNYKCDGQYCVQSKPTIRSTFSSQSDGWVPKPGYASNLCNSYGGDECPGYGYIKDPRGPTYGWTNTGTTAEFRSFNDKLLTSLSTETQSRTTWVDANNPGR